MVSLAWWQLLTGIAGVSLYASCLRPTKLFHEVCIRILTIGVSRLLKAGLFGVLGVYVAGFLLLASWMFQFASFMWFYTLPLVWAVPVYTICIVMMAAAAWSRRRHSRKVAAK